MKLFRKVAIVGVGLIGGSIGLAIKKRRLAAEVIGVSRRQKTINNALRRGAIDKGSADLRIIKDADLVILAPPVNSIIKIAPLVSKMIKEGCILSDVGSTKKEIVSKLEKTFPNYIGAHPLAGSQKAGVAYASSEMFKDSLCLLTPTHRTKNHVLRKVSRLWQEMGAKVICVSPEEHDKILSFVSHLPHVIAFNLIDLIPRQYLKFVASGLKDATRIASSEPQLWQDIFMTNRKDVLRALKGFYQRLHKFERLLSKKDTKGLYRFLSKAKQKRDSL